MAEALLHRAGRNIATRARTQGKGGTGRITPRCLILGCLIFRRLILGLVVAHALVNLTFLKVSRDGAIHPGRSPLKHSALISFPLRLQLKSLQGNQTAFRRAQRNRNGYKITQINPAETDRAPLKPNPGV